MYRYRYDTCEVYVTHNYECILLVQYLAFLTVVKQMHVVDSLGTVFPEGDR